MKLIVQIPCYNEAGTLAEAVADIPRTIPGIKQIEILIVDDGSVDGTSDLARKLGVDHIIRHRRNKGLARTFHRGLEECLRLGADIIVNTDGDNQYAGADISRLVQPIVNEKVDIVVGDRGGLENPHFSRFKRYLQVFGSTIIRMATGLHITDAVSGFRAISRDAAQQINIVSDFSYTIEMLIQASAKRISVMSVPVGTNSKTRESRLFKSIPQFLRMSVTTLLRMYTMYRPLRVFSVLGLIMVTTGLLPIFRFGYFYAVGESSGHIQSLILGGMLFSVGILTMLCGILADLINFNRKLMEKTLLRLEKLEQSGAMAPNQLTPVPATRFHKYEVQRELDELTRFMQKTG